MIESFDGLVLATQDVEKTLGVPSSAFFGLVGVLVGAVIATVGDWLLERHRDDRAEAAENTVRQRQLREAARLVDLELSDAESIIGESIYRTRWWDPGRQFSSDVFSTHRSTLAVELEDDDWSRLATAYFGLNELNWRHSRAALDRQNARGGGFDDDVIFELRSWAESIFEARKALAPHSSSANVELYGLFTANEYVEAHFRTAQEEYDHLHGIAPDE